MVFLKPFNSVFTEFSTQTFVYLFNGTHLSLIKTESSVDEMLAPNATHNIINHSLLRITHRNKIEN